MKIEHNRRVAPRPELATHGSDRKHPGNVVDSPGVPSEPPPHVSLDDGRGAGRHVGGLQPLRVVGESDADVAVPLGRYGEL